MEQLTEKNKKVLVIALISIIIIAGIIVITLIGFNKQQRYEQCQRIDLRIEQKVELEKIKEKVDEVLGKNNIVQVVEIYQDMVTIRAKSISEEQKNDIENKIKEIYDFSQTAEDTSIVTVQETRIRDMYKQYILPCTISGILVLVYMLIRYYKIGIVNVLTRTICIPIISEILLLSILAITRIPIGMFTPVLIIVTYVISILYVIRKNENFYNWDATNSKKSKVCSQIKGVLKPQEIPII